MDKKEKEICEVILRESLDYDNAKEFNNWGGTTYYDSDGHLILRISRTMTFINAYQTILKIVKNKFYSSGEDHTKEKIKNAFDFLFE